MTRLELIEAIAAQLQALGLPVERGNGTDLSIHQEFLDAGWSTGSKKITYDSAILLDEQRRTVLMYEKTAEVGSGFSFGSSSESSVQSGKTLMRKVTSVQYGPEGQVYNVEIDLGAIPKAVREAAAAQGWDFTTVIRRSKAMYSDGHGPVEVPEPAMAGAAAAGAAPAPPPPSGPPAAVPPPPPAPPTASPERRGGRGFLIAVIVLAVLAALMLLLLKAGPVGWIVSAAVIVGLYFVRRVLPPGTGGTVIASVLWVVALVLVLVAGAISAPSTDPSTPAPAASGAPSAAATQPAPSAPVVEPTAGGFQLVSGNLTTDVNLKFDDAAGFDSTVVAVGHVDQEGADVDVRLAYSADSGATWAWGAPLAKAGEQWPEAVLVDPKGAIVVGWQRTRTGDETGPSQAFIAAASAPDFVLKEIPAPKEFAGRIVDLYDIANVDGTWVIVGSVGTDAVRGGIWRSTDEGGTWTKQEVMNGKEWLVPRRLVIGPDGSWNLVGAAGTPGAKFHAVWLRSTDKGRTFTSVQPKAFASTTDEAGLQLVLSDDGSAALLGGTESADGQYMNALWVSNSKGEMQRLDKANLPVQEGGNLNLGGLLFFNNELISYGSPKSMTYGPVVQFWKLNQDGTWSTGATIESPATSYVNQVIIGGDTALALGLHDDGSGNDSIGVWRGLLG